MESAPKFVIVDRRQGVAPVFYKGQGNILWVNVAVEAKTFPSKFAAKSFKKNFGLEAHVTIEAQP